MCKVAKVLAAWLAFACIAIPGTAQRTVPVFGKITLLNGYVRSISGERIPYRSSYPDYAKIALLTRCTDGNKTIEWETDPLPAGTRGGYTYFTWLAAHSAGSSSANRSFDLYINGEHCLTFTTRMKAKPPYWSFEGKDGTGIVFETVMGDIINDLYGNMYLKVPEGKYPVGKPLRIKVTGHKEQSNDWYMAFEYAYTEKIDITPMPALIREGNKTRQVINVTVDHIKGADKLSLKIDGKERTFPIRKGYNDLDIPVDTIAASKPVHLSASISGGITVEKDVMLEPVSNREVWLVPHSHNDIGYSHLQEEVARIQCKNIDDALRNIARTNNFSREAQYKWNVESMWAVEHYLRDASPQKKDAFIHAVKEGKIVLAAFQANLLTGICKPEELMHSTDLARQLSAQYNIPFKTVMVSDVPGFNWSIIPALAFNGIKYFSSGPNYMGGMPEGGDRVGYSSLSWNDKPFYWVSPSGKEKVLFWMAGKGYSSFHGFGPGDLFRRGKKTIMTYMKELDGEGYPYSMVQWRYNIGSDNGPIDSTVSDFVEQWNRKYLSPRLVVGNVTDMFEKFERLYGQQLPAFAGDMTPYWEDGAVSTAAEEGMNRLSSERLLQAGALACMTVPQKYLSDSFTSAWRNIIMFHEHTWGAYNSISDPDNPFALAQWDYKKKFAADAATASMNFLNAFLPKTEKGQGLVPDNGGISGGAAGIMLDVFNTCSWNRTDLVRLDSSLARYGFAMADEQGQPVPVQRLASGELVFLAREVPALGVKRYRLLPVTGNQGTAPGQPPASNSKEHPMKPAASFSNDWVQLEIDPANGSIRSLRLRGKEELVDTAGGMGMNQYFYVPGYDPSKSQKNNPPNITLRDSGPLLTAFRLESRAPGTNGLAQDIVIYHELERVDICNTIDKKAIREKESVHFGFPFRVKEGVIRMDLGWGVMRPNADQLAGANKDYFSAQRWVDVSNQDHGISLLLREAPLVEIGEMIDERRGDNGLKKWKRTLNPSPILYSYVMNNYWHTNYKADQGGTVSFNYSLVPHGLFNLAETQKLGMAFNQPLIAIPAVPGTLLAAPLFALDNNNILVTSLTPGDSTGTMAPSAATTLHFRLFNAGGEPGRVKILWKGFLPSTITVSDTEGQKNIGAGDTLFLPAFGILNIEATK